MTESKAKLFFYSGNTSIMEAMNTMLKVCREFINAHIMFQGEPNYIPLLSFSICFSIPSRFDGFISISFKSTDGGSSSATVSLFNFLPNYRHIISIFFFFKAFLRLLLFFFPILFMLCIFLMVDSLGIWEVVL